MLKPIKNKKQINVARHAGFCFGVRRAVEMAKDTLQKQKTAVFCLGEIIHNPRAVEGLEKLGLKTIENLKKVKKGETVIIRSHGVSPAVISELERKEIKIIDATCPFVKKAQKAAADFKLAGRQVVIFGDPNHPEVVGIKGRSQKSIVVQDEKDAKKLKKFSRVGLLAQTTQKPDVFKKIVAEVSTRTKDLQVAQTICLDSFEKKEEVKKIAQKVEVMIVVGGKKSNNTKKLAEVAIEAGVKTYCVESAAQLKAQWFLGVEKIGLAAGASTPDESIAEVASKIRDIV